MNNNDWLDIDVLEDYLDGKLDAKAMHHVERLSLEDPFVAEALAGLSLSPKRVQSLSLLQKQLQERIAQKPIEEKRWQITSHRLSIAAAAAVLFVTVSLLFWMKESNQREKLSAGNTKTVEAVIKPKAEIEKVITEPSKSTIATHLKKPAKPAILPVAAAPTSEVEVDQTLLKAGKLERKREDVSSEQISKALAGKVSGVQIDRNLIKGKVSGEDKLPIPGVSVMLRGTSVATVTDRDGNFSLSADSVLKDQKLRLSSIGYLSKEVAVAKGQNSSIELTPNNSSLNEIVVVGYGSQKKQALTGSVANNFVPVGGWVKFEEYIITHNKLIKDKKLSNKQVTVTFQLNDRGEPINLNVIKVAQQTEAEEKEAVRLIKEGPKWVIPVNGNPLAITSVNVKF